MANGWSEQTGISSLDDPLSSWYLQMAQRQQGQQPQGPQPQSIPARPGIGVPGGPQAGATGGGMGAGMQLTQPPFSPGGNIQPVSSAQHPGQALAANFLGGIFNAVQNKKQENQQKQYQQSYNLWQQLMGAQDALAKDPNNMQAKQVIDYITGDPKSRKMIEESLGVMMPGGDASKQTPVTQGAQHGFSGYLQRLKGQFDPRTQAMRLPTGAGFPVGQQQAAGGMPAGGAPQGQQPMTQMAGLQMPWGQTSGFQMPSMGGGQQPQGRPGPPSAPSPPSPTSAPQAPGASGAGSQPGGLTAASYFYPAVDPATAAYNQEMRRQMTDPETVKHIVRQKLGQELTPEQQATLDIHKAQLASTEKLRKAQEDLDKERIKKQEEDIKLGRTRAYLAAVEKQSRDNAVRVKAGLPVQKYVDPAMFGLTEEDVKNIPGAWLAKGVTTDKLLDYTKPVVGPGGSEQVAATPGAPTPTPTKPRTTAPTPPPTRPQAATPTTPPAAPPTTPTAAAAAPTQPSAIRRVGTGEPGEIPGTARIGGASDAKLIRDAPVKPGYSAVVETTGKGKDKQKVVEYVPDPGTPAYNHLHRNEFKPIPGTGVNYGPLPADPLRAIVDESAAEYRTDPQKMFSSFSGQRELYMKEILTYKPTWDISKYGERYQTRKSYAPGGADAKINSSLDNIAGHIYDLSKNFERFGNTFNATANEIYHKGRIAADAGWENAWKADATAVSDELAVALTGRATDQEISHYKAVIMDPYASPQSYKDTIQSIANLLSQRFVDQDWKWRNKMGESRDFAIMSPRAIDSLKKMGINNEMTQDVMPGSRVQTFINSF